MTLAVASFMVTAGSAVSSYESQSQQAAAQDQYYEQNKVNAERAEAYEQQQLALRERQEQDATGMKRFDAGLETRAKAANATVAAGEAGISGLSVDALIADIYGSGNRTQDRIAQNGEMTLGQINAEKRSADARKVDRINSVKKGVAPSGLALGLNIASAGLNSASSYRNMTK